MKIIERIQIQTNATLTRLNYQSEIADRVKVSSAILAIITIATFVIIILSFDLYKLISHILTTIYERRKKLEELREIYELGNHRRTDGRNNIERSHSNCSTSVNLTLNDSIELNRKMMHLEVELSTRELLGRRSQAGLL